MKRLRIFIAVLLVFAFIAFLLAIPFLFPPPSVLKCNDNLDSSWGYQPYSYVECIKYVAAIRGKEGICRYITDSYDLKDCYQTVEEFREKGYDALYDLDDYCGIGYYSDETICEAAKLAKEGR